MVEPHYDTPESIFTIPKELTAIQKADLISHTIARMMGTTQTVAASVEGGVEMSERAIPDCLYGVCGQLEQLD